MSHTLFQVLYTFNLYHNFLIFLSHFKGEETETQRDAVTCPGSCSYDLVELGLEPRQSDYRANADPTPKYKDIDMVDKHKKSTLKWPSSKERKFQKQRELGARTVTTALPVTSAMHLIDFAQPTRSLFFPSDTRTNNVLDQSTEQLCLHILCYQWRN